MNHLNNIKALSDLVMGNKKECNMKDPVDHGKAIQASLARQSEFYRKRENEPNYFTAEDAEAEQ